MRLPRFARHGLPLAIGLTVFMSGCNDDAATTNAAQTAPAAVQTQTAVTPEQVVTHYASVAHAVYEDALVTAKTLQSAIEALLSTPSQETLHAAREAWLAARVPYQQSEVFRFGNAVVDDWEGQLNAWPLDEGFIDYVASDRYQAELGNPGATANIIANTNIALGGDTLDASTLTAELLASLNEAGGSEANVATGYHAIEFLLWGQDLNGHAAGAGNRPYTDFVQGEGCTGGNCDRRAAYLRAAAQLLVNDLEWMTAQWAEGSTSNYRAALLKEEAASGLRKMLFGMGSLSLGELAGERMKVALEANSWEDEHDCFSDNTHNSHYYNGLGVQNVYLGRYVRVNGQTLEGPSLANLVASKNTALDTQLRADLEAGMAALEAIRAQATQGQTFDMLIAPENAKGAEVVNGAIRALVKQTGSIEQVAGALGITDLNPDTADHTF